MDEGDLDFDWEGLERDILRSISIKVSKNAFEPCGVNEVTYLAFFCKEQCFFFLVLSLTLSTIFNFEF